ncbi:MAG: dTDP-4-dehydrorhamnose reductase [Alphaproteobacteria bacterium]|nr:dTDP-4-dehydrorhamnose reductase [Alphaproteobacteria bacterium]
MPLALVFGASGQIGRALLEAAPAAGWRVRALARSDVDIFDVGAVAAATAANSPDAIVNAAAYTAVDRAETDEAQAMRVNAEAPGTFAAAAAAAEIPFVHLSTDYVFDGTSRVPYKEADPVAPLNVYGRTKRAGEIAAYRAGGRCVILRTSWVFAPWGNNFVRTVLRLARERPELRIVDDQRGAPTGAEDIAKTIFRILDRLSGADVGNRTGLFHYQGRPPTTWADFAEAALDEAAAFGHPRPKLVRIPTSEYPTPAKRPANGILDCARIARDFDVTPPDWRPALARAVRGLLESL